MRVDVAIVFNSRCFNAEPAKVKCGYANFAIANRRSDGGGMMGADPADMSLYMAMFHRHTEITRTVEEIPGGVRTTTPPLAGIDGSQPPPTGHADDELYGSSVDVMAAVGELVRSTTGQWIARPPQHCPRGHPPDPLSDGVTRSTPYPNRPGAARRNSSQ